MNKNTGTLVAVSLVIFLTAVVALGERTAGPQVWPASPPQWTLIPGGSGVAYAPNLEQDLFRYEGGFFSLHKGAWYRAQAIAGPWLPIPEPPRVFYTIQAPYFKAPPGWARGQKTGWGGAALPPGQMKHRHQGHAPAGKAKGKGGHYRQ